MTLFWFWWYFFFYSSLNFSPHSRHSRIEWEGNTWVLTSLWLLWLPWNESWTGVRTFDQLLGSEKQRNQRGKGEEDAVSWPVNSALLNFFYLLTHWHLSHTLAWIINMAGAWQEPRVQFSLEMLRQVVSQALTGPASVSLASAPPKDVKWLWLCVRGGWRSSEEKKEGGENERIKKENWNKKKRGERFLSKNYRNQREDQRPSESFPPAAATKSREKHENNKRIGKKGKTNRTERARESGRAR